MKKILSIVAILGLTIMVSCGLSPEEKAAALKAKQDSLETVYQAEMDSIKQSIEDSIASAAADMAEKEQGRNQIIADSLAAIESKNK